MVYKQLTETEQEPDVKFVRSKTWRLSTARANYMAGMSDTDNAAQVGVSRQTISIWKGPKDQKGHGWEEEKIALATVVREKYIENESERIVKDITTIDTEHRDIAQRLRQKYRLLAMSEARIKTDEVMGLSALVELGGKLIRLEREVLGLDKIKKLATPPQFPTSFLIQLETKDGPVVFDPVRLSAEGIKDIEDLLPNQNPFFYGEAVNPEDNDDEAIQTILNTGPELPYTQRMIN